MKNNYLLIISIFLIISLFADKSYCQIDYGIKIGVNFDNIGDINNTTTFKKNIQTASIASAHLGIYAQLKIVDFSLIFSAVSTPKNLEIKVATDVTIIIKIIFSDSSIFSFY